ncbi:MAG TPA: FUSC family membrane protein [Pusillimonas sp.]|uniref:FUSC family protein n=1 Tax=Pusillimonas sp. TaxID=3040095 RepID=UPI002B5EC872|nr:FUSC family membrane protein [Pusillimonas sp.]HUH88672.1 FUSC family membrane protein [Pusillimonas sp.]
MATRIPQLQRFFYSHYFFGGLRQALGVMMPALLIGGLWQAYDIGMIAAIGAACVAVIDQPGSPRRYSVNTMLGAVLLGTLTVAITGLVSSHPIALWLTIPLLGFAFSMLTVYGQQGGLMAFACLLIMTLTMRTPLSGQQLLLHIGYSLAGGLFYFAYSSVVRRVFWLREEQQALSVALFATADYVEARSRFYDVHTDLDTTYRQLIRAQAEMIEKQQAARNTVLREQPRGSGRGDRQRMKALNLFIDMVALLDTLIATHTDYATLHRELSDSDVLVFARDTLVKLSDNLQQIALCTARNQAALSRHSAKAELRAIEYELEQYRQNGFAQAHPEVYALLVQVLRRLRNGSRIVERMATHTQPGADTTLVDQRLHKALDRFISRSELRFGMITSNLRLDSPHFRYALRVAIAILITLGVVTLINAGLTRQPLGADLELHGYWVILTVIVIMKPGFALTRQRNGLRLAGTIIGCLLTLVLFALTDNADVLLAALIMSCILGYSLVQVSFMGTAIFKTVMVLLAFHLISPTTNALIGERLIDTALGCAIALISSYILPWWEHNYMESLAKALRTANHRYFRAGLHYAELIRAARGNTVSPELRDSREAEQLEADMAWRLARKNVYIAFGNYAAAFYRMAAEPARRQKNVPELNNLLVQNHVLTSQISAAVPLLATLLAVPAGINQALETVESLLQGKDATPPTSLETEGELATLAYPLRQMMTAAQLIRHEMQALESPCPEDATPPTITGLRSEAGG